MPGYGRTSLAGATAGAVFVTAPRAIMALLILIGIAINFANVISRYVFRFALFWAEEVMIFLTVWCVGLGIVVAAFNGAHLRMDLLSARLGSPWRQLNNAFTALVFILTCAFVALQSMKVVALVYRSGQVSVAASVPVFIPHTALLLGFTLMALAVIVRLRAHVTGRF